MEIISDRLEMHKNIGIQRDNWNHLLLSSINMMTLSAASMIGLASVSSSGVESPLLALKVSSTILYMASTGLLLLMNKVQPSQLSEEQRNAVRFFKQLQGEFKTRLVLGNVTEFDVDEAMEKVLALDKAFPLPLLGSMIEKFPQNVKPAIWWPQRKQKYKGQNGKLKNNNGWDLRLEEEMKKIVMVLKKKDMGKKLKLSEFFLKLNKILAVSGPILTCLAAVGSVFLGSVNSTWPVMLAIICGGLASVVNTIEHGGQVGMVFEFYRGASGFFQLMEETIEVNLNEDDFLKRENGELFEIKLALQLGRSVSELRQFSDLLPSLDDDDDDACEEFASKLF
ncbi:probable F-box protein At4g22030 [Cicer arietinum]|uniref:Probable F-box protein At4g22030 n=1 Tax=Cicer arietinum TaxID=3827 RepID=A0A1S2XAH3_CICAR|nr:probable F-box protein At4g22030 [Cicer arietinum]